MICINSVILIGRLTKDPELRFIAGSGIAVCKFTIAVDRAYKKEGGENTDFFSVVVWRKPAENCANYLVKGQRAAVKGRIENRKYTTNGGENRQISEIIAEAVDFLDKPKNSKSGNSNNRNNEIPSGFSPIDENDNDNDIPF